MVNPRYKLTAPPDPGEMQSLLDNCTRKQVCEFYGFSAPSLHHWAKKLGLTLPPPKSRRKVTWIRTTLGKTGEQK